MSSYKTILTQNGFPAAISLINSRGCVVVKNANNTIRLMTATTDTPYGILTNEPEVGAICEVATVGGGAPAKVSGVIALGTYVTSDATGRLVEATTAGANIVGITREASTAENDLVELEINYMKFTVTA